MMLEIILNLSVLFVALVCLLISLLIGSSAIAILFTKVPFVPTPKRNVKIIIDQLALKPGQIFYDLGCGDGRFLIEAQNRGAKAIGFEISLWAYLRAKINLLINKSQAKIFYKNFYQANLSNASGVFCFLMDTVMPKVEAKLKKELGIGAKIVCYGFPLPSWPPEKIIDLKPKDRKSSKIYLYRK